MVNNLNRKLIYLSLIAIILLYGANYWYFFTKQLDEPIFLKHYYSQNLYEENQEISFNLYYLTNKRDPLTISHVEIDGLVAYVQDDVGNWTWDHNQPSVNYHDEYNHQYLLSTSIQIMDIAETLELKEGESWTFHTMKVYFSNGYEMDADIGSVTITRDALYENSPLQSQLSGSSNQGYSEEVAIAQEPLTIDSITIGLPHDVSDLIQLKINAESSDVEEYFQDRGQPNSFIDMDSQWDAIPGQLLTENFKPIDLKEKEYLYVISKISDENIHYLEFPIILSGKTKQGEVFEYQTLVSEQPYFDQKQINEIIKNHKK